MTTLVAPATVTVPVTIDPVVVVAVYDTPVDVVDVIVDLPGTTPNRVIFTPYNYLFFGDQVIYGTN